MYARTGLAHALQTPTMQNHGNIPPIGFNPVRQIAVWQCSIGVIERKQWRRLLRLPQQSKGPEELPCMCVAHVWSASGRCMRIHTSNDDANAYKKPWKPWVLVPTFACLPRHHACHALDHGSTDLVRHHVVLLPANRSL